MLENNRLDFDIRMGDTCRERGAHSVPWCGSAVEGMMRCSALLPLLIVVACSSKAGSDSSRDPSNRVLSRSDMLDANQCKSCHADHVSDWSTSMHAYASDDPVFLAMNRRGQRETNGALGPFCVKCHAPMALREGATTDGLNLASLPQSLKGVTCFFCHTAESVEGTHNNPVRLSSSMSMLGSLRDAMPSVVHDSAYSPLHDRDQSKSASLCGSCHDVVTPHGAAIERTFIEWKDSVFSRPGGATCGQCHMAQSTELRPIARISGAPLRRYHDHSFVGLDIAITPDFPGIAAQQTKVQALLNTTLQSALCVTESHAIRVALDNVAAGHNWPSGASQDRRAWAEVIAYKAGAVIYQSGAFGDREAIDSARDADLWLLRDCMFDTKSKPTAMFWEAASYSAGTLPAPLTINPSDPQFYRTHVEQRYPRAQGALLETMPDRVTLRMRVQPIGLDVIDDLIASGDLGAEHRPQMPVFDIGQPDGSTILEWTRERANLRYVENGVLASCVSASNFDVTADKTPAPNAAVCSAPAVPPPPPTVATPPTSTTPVDCRSDLRIDQGGVPIVKPGLAGAFTFTLAATSPSPPARGKNSWTLKLQKRGGEPVVDAVITAKPSMPDHGHGAPAVPTATSLGGGTYTLGPVMMFMPGVWQVTVTAESGGVRDSALFYFCIAG